MSKYNCGTHRDSLVNILTLVESSQESPVFRHGECQDAQIANILSTPEMITIKEELVVLTNQLIEEEKARLQAQINFVLSGR